MEQIILTGDRCTGRLHIGHYAGSLRQRVALQNSGNFDAVYVMIADAQALTDNADTPEEIHTKVMSMYTAPDHLLVSDPGRTEGNPVFTYLEAFCTQEHFAAFLPEYANLEELEAHYRRGGLGDVKVKRFLERVLQEELAPIRTRREAYARQLPEVLDILRQGCETARATAARTLSDVRRAMGLDYFADDLLLKRG